MRFPASKYLFWGFCLWILSGNFLSGFQHKRSLDSSSSHLSNDTRLCSDCKAPEFDKPLQNRTVVKGKKVLLKCYASGNPKPEVTWYRNGKAIRNKSGPFSIIERNGSFRLKIRMVELSDAGWYICVANNSFGRAQTQAYLTVNSVNPKSTPHKPTLENTPSSSAPLASNTQATELSQQANPGYSTRDEGQDKPTFGDEDIPTPPSLSENGSCVIYNGTICEKLLKGQPIFVRSYEKLENIEKKISIAYSRIQDYKKISKQCRPFVQPLLCHFNFPSCDKTSSVPTPRHICYEKCEFLRTDICKNEYLEARKASLQGVLLPECSTLPRKDSKQGKNCISKLKGNTQRNTKPVVGKNATPMNACYKDRGEDFRANVSVTEKGLKCQHWNATKPHHHILSPTEYPELAGGHNFCRNPGGKKEKPWCFTTDVDFKFDYCDIPSCDKTSTTPPSIQIVSILYTVIPCLLFAIIFSLVVIFICWRYHKQIIYQAAQTAATPLVPVVGKSSYPKIKEMRRETVRFIKDVGEGEFGKLYKGEVLEKVEGIQTRAILAKVLRNSSSARNRETFLRQAETWSKFSHPNVISIVGMCYNGPPTCILYECVEYGTLHDYLVENSPLEGAVDDDEDPEPLNYYDQLQIAIQIAAGMNYVSQHNYIHGDLAARNCMVGPRMTVKITDMALSRNPFSDDYCRVPNRPPMPIRWMAPEGVLNYRFTVETDIWSFGVVLWEIFSFGSRPHEGCSDEEVMDHIREHVLLPCPADCPARIFFLMKECWDILPPSRPRFSTIYTQLCALRWDTNGPREPLEKFERECFHVDV
ncbi:unnamed protein product [Pocillopora meandrina]|uniref:Receptor protein-tyrosine kinase n=1 Tax=Pocillopora meandrina TaxID=46732 RepID=A0AAU9WKH7_9CNID|nr:unnamed protein product [Pocillopora meandrina]